MISGLSGREYEERCKEIGLKTLEERRKIQDMQLLQGIVHGRGGMSIEGLFERADERDGIRTRQAVGTNNLKVQAARTDIRKNFFTIRAAKAWNELPDSFLLLLYELGIAEWGQERGRDALYSSRK
jgi:hypothetical protein